MGKIDQNSFRIAQDSFRSRWDAFQSGTDWSYFLQDGAVCSELLWLWAVAVRIPLEAGRIGENSFGSGRHWSVLFPELTGLGLKTNQSLNTALYYYYFFNLNILAQSSERPLLAESTPPDYLHLC